MFEEYQICPYTGLRSFTEEESLYFKGREEHIEQATHQLERNKFLMLTGASGDGKSSLVYAGIVPNARAGFLKAKYTQWHVADFRPERTPFKNLCKTLTRQLGIVNSGIVESELQHGFSALVDLYKSSDCFLDVEGTEWKQADDKQKAALKRKAANLMVIVDQFEEFFTNPENYHQGVPSRDSNLVLNILLETARIALEEDLPIYIVFTMRSDYIGQCAAFRSLPEYLGFSQFFVPRLNRVQLQQVIEEPATLSGNRISRRLTERLIHDIAEGVDQLPILQHALNQIWHAANKGTEEMDLIHYAMVSGMPANELPDDQIERFNTWFAQLPEEIKKCYHRPDLQNVLDTHANKLYESAEEHYLKKTGKKIPDAVSKLIIKTAFSCLTKIDQSRAVRNRMTLKEIQQIINQKEINSETIGQVLDIFREPGNTFIRPFITDDPESASLGEENVLDITHESLIRNWDLLKTWAKEEYDSYLVSQDYEQQLGRWVESGKSKDYLLSIGPLTYFENWFNKVKPNTWWIARYLPEEEEQGNKVKKAETILNNSKEFLERSAQKHVITRTVMRLGPKRIGAVAAALGLLVISSFGFANYLKQQNSVVLNAVTKSGIAVANNTKLSEEYPVPLLVQQMELGITTLPEILAEVVDPLQKIRLAIGVANLLILQGWGEPAVETTQSFSIADSLLGLSTMTQDAKQVSSYLQEMNNLRVPLGFAKLYGFYTNIDSISWRNALRSGQWVLQILKNQPESFTDIQQLTLALENALNHKCFTQNEIQELIHLLSPFEGDHRSPWIEKNFERNKLLIRGRINYAFKYNGLFQELAYLYAALGDSEKALKCVDSLLAYNEVYYQNDYEAFSENATNIVGVFHLYGYHEALERFVDGYCNRKRIPKVQFYHRTISRIITDQGLADHTNFYTVTGLTYSNLNLQFAPDDLLTLLYDRLFQVINSIPDPDTRNLSLAVAYKNRGCLMSARYEMRRDSTPHLEIDSLFWQSYRYYTQVSGTYLAKNTTAINTSASDVINIPQQYFYLYPDYHVPFHPFEPRSWVFAYNSPAFLEFVLDHQLTGSLYKNKEDFKPFESWLMNYHAVSTSRDYFMRLPMPYHIMVKLAATLESREVGNALDLNLLYLYLGNEAIQRDFPDQASKYYERIKPEKALNSFQFKGYDFINNYSFEQYAIAIYNLFTLGNTQQANILLNVFKKQVNRSSLYGYTAQQIVLNNKDRQMAQAFIDSSQAEMDKLDDPAVFQPNRIQQAIALVLLDAARNENRAQATIKNSFNKFDALQRFSFAHAFHGDLYKAYNEIPDNIADEDQATFLYFLLLGHTKANPPVEAWKTFEKNVLFVYRFYLPYINEND